jgi:hypothetical protein
MQLAAAIIETRLEKLTTAVPAHLNWLPETTHLHIFTDASLYGAVAEMFPSAQIHAVTITPSQYFRDLNAVMTTSAFWETFAPADRVLIFQHDSGILRRGIEEFYEWDYIGAPFGPAYPFVGNGGFSLRNPVAMAHICRELHYSPYLPEDTFFPIGCEMLGYRLATVEAAMQFSCEIHPLMGTLGYHAIDRYLTPDEVRRIKTQYQQLSLSLPSDTITLPL